MLEDRDLDEEARRATDMLAGKSVRRVLRHHAGEVGIEFTDGTRLFVDGVDGGVELSITDGRSGGG